MSALRWIVSALSLLIVAGALPSSTSARGNGCSPDFEWTGVSVVNNNKGVELGFIDTPPADGSFVYNRAITLSQAEFLFEFTGQFYLIQYALYSSQPA